MKSFKTKMPVKLLLYSLTFVINLLILWFFLFNHHVLAMPWLLICLANLVVVLAIISGWQRTLLLLDQTKIVICRPSGWKNQVNLVINLFEINRIEFEVRYLTIGRFDSQVAVKFGPLAKIDDLRHHLKQLLPKIVL